MVAVQCAVLKGDHPLEITWRHNNISISTSADITIGQSSSRISSLNIESVQANHRGTFQCIAMNLAGRSQVSAELMVNGIYLMQMVMFHGFSYFLFFTSVWLPKIAVLPSNPSSSTNRCVLIW